ncbi:MAG: superfamily I DNA/RNA helicase, partial [Cellvibrionaceae bacterium]
MTPLPNILKNYPLSPSQQTAALTRTGDVVVRAGAGTGKTRTLVGRYLALLSDEVPLRNIVAMTFTRKA